jgi:hypothetical protein
MPTCHIPIYFLDTATDTATARVVEAAHLVVNPDDQGHVNIL